MPEGALPRATLVRAEGYVWCEGHGCIHEDTLNPYGEGFPSSRFNGMSGVSKAMVHRTVYYRARKGDYPPDKP